MGVGRPQEIDPALVYTGGARSGSLFEFSSPAVFPGGLAVLKVDAEQDILRGIERRRDRPQGALPELCGDVVFFEPGIEAFLAGEFMILDSIKLFENLERGRIRPRLQSLGYDTLPALVVIA